MVRSPWHLLAAIFFTWALMLAPASHAGSISFVLSLTGAELRVTNAGDSSAYYPQVLHLKNDGRWEPLANQRAIAELRPKASFRAQWLDLRPPSQLAGLERHRALMVRFFDQAGVGFGQISFFERPPAAGYTVSARYVGGQLRLRPPPDSTRISATWVLAPLEEGIAPLSRPVRFTHQQPPARRIVWQGGDAIDMSTGAGLAAAVLVHETPQGFTFQAIPDGGMQGREQRPAWLDAARLWYLLTQLGLGAAFAVVLYSIFSSLRRRTR